jgi:thiol-disulfide isomerase/thioredoxin
VKSRIKNVWKFTKNHLDWIIFAVIAALIFTQRWPQFQANSALEGRVLSPITLIDSNKNEIPFPPQDNLPSVAIVWNTWCVPCKVEMARLEHAIKKGSLNGNRVFAINLGESLSTVQEHLKENSYSFKVLLDIKGDAGTQLGASVTPTLYLINANGEIGWASSGVGLTEVWRMENHLR